LESGGNLNYKTCINGINPPLNVGNTANTISDMINLVDLSLMMLDDMPKK